jgi:DNA-binding NarL/FixJ family response regulator
MKTHIDANLKVLILDTDYYSLQAINSYLAWDRRTRVTRLCESVEEMWAHLQHAPTPELPDVIVLDSDHLGGAAGLRDQLQRLRQKLPRCMLVCMMQQTDLDLIKTAIHANVNACLLKNDVRQQIAWAIIYALDHAFVVTDSIAQAGHDLFERAAITPSYLPQRKEFPELTQRIRQAIELCVVKGMPAHLAADEMGISLHTIRSYIKEGYRILEAYDGTEYPADMSPQERAFMRLTSFREA